ncbi:MAG TPA: hypothetical protein VGN23_10360, partial [Verrucomicrobiae bacterium]
KRKFFVAAIVFLFMPHCRAQVYSTAVYSMGHSYWNLSSTALPSPPYNYSLTKVTWQEDTNGYTIMDIFHKPVPSDVEKRSIEVECGSETFPVYLDFLVSQSMKGSGDLSKLVAQCVTNRGGLMTTNALPIVHENWIFDSRPIEDVVVMDGDHFAEAQKFLERAYGKPDTGIISTNLNEDGHSLTYLPAQIGVTLNLTYGAGLTIVSVISKQKP